MPYYYKISPRQCVEAFKRYKEGNITIVALAKDYGISTSNMRGKIETLKRVEDYERWIAHKERSATSSRYRYLLRRAAELETMLQAIDAEMNSLWKGMSAEEQHSVSTLGPAYKRAR